MTVSVKAPTSTTGSIQLNGSDVLTIDSSGNLTAPNNITVNGNLVTDTNTFYVDSTNNRVGIGTSSPQRQLHIHEPSSDGSFIHLTNDTTGSTGNDGFDVLLGSDENGYVNMRENNNLIFKTNDTERMRILPAGNVGIGSTTVTANAQLHVERGGSNLRVVHFENTRNTSGDECVRSVLGSNCNNTSSYHYIASTNGDRYYLYGNGTYGTVSDENLKKNIETTRDGYLDDIKNLRVVKYNWATDEDNTPKELGWIAQEVEQIFPNLVQEGLPQEDGNTYKTVKTSVLPFILLKALQEAADKIDALETRIQALESA